jgi:hypothetical protein
MRAVEWPGGSYASEGMGMQRSRGADSTSAQPRSPEKVRVVLCEDHDPFREGVAEMLGGELRVDSRHGGGTKVEVRVLLDGR